VNEVYDKLSFPFPDESVKQVKKGAAKLDYIPVSEIVNRLNTVLGVENWSFEVVNVFRDLTNPEFVVAHTRLTALIDGREVRRDGMGGQKTNTKSDGSILDLGDDFKGAVSDGLKKAASSLGVGLYLSREIDAMEAEQAIEAPQPTVRPTDEKNPNSEVDAAYVNFLSQVNGLPAEKKPLIGEFWKGYGNGRPKPTRATATLEDVEALSAEVIRLTFDAEGV